MNSYDVIEEAVKAFWRTTYPQDVIAFFYQKYDFQDDNEWEWCEELVNSHSSTDYENMTFQTDFCEGQNCVKDVTIVTLDEVTSYYTKHKLKQEGAEHV